MLIINQILNLYAYNPLLSISNKLQTSSRLLVKNIYKNIRVDQINSLQAV